MPLLSRILAGLLVLPLALAPALASVGMRCEDGHPCPQRPTTLLQARQAVHGCCQREPEATMCELQAVVAELPIRCVVELDRAASLIDDRAPAFELQWRLVGIFAAGTFQAVPAARLMVGVWDRAPVARTPFLETRSPRGPPRVG